MKTLVNTRQPVIKHIRVYLHADYTRARVPVSLAARRVIVTDTMMQVLTKDNNTYNFPREVVERVEVL